MHINEVYDKCIFISNNYSCVQRDCNSKYCQKTLSCSIILNYALLLNNACIYTSLDVAGGNVMLTALILCTSGQRSVCIESRYCISKCC